MNILKSEISPEEVEQLMSRELLTVQQAAKVVMYRMNMGYTYFYRYYRKILPFQNLSLESSHGRFMRINTRKLDAAIRFFIEHPEFQQTIVNLSTQRRAEMLKDMHEFINQKTKRK